MGAGIAQVTAAAGFKTVVLEVQDDVLKKGLGRIHKFLDDPDADTRKVARRHGRKDLKVNAKPEEELTLTHPGVPMVRRGDALRVKLGNEFGMKRIVFVKTVEHVLSAGDYTMELTVDLDDPYHDEDDARKKRKKKRAARNRNRRGEHRTTQGERARRQPAKHRQRRG